MPGPLAQAAQKLSAPWKLSNPPTAAQSQARHPLRRRPMRTVVQPQTWQGKAPAMTRPERQPQWNGSRPHSSRSGRSLGDGARLGDFGQFSKENQGFKAGQGHVLDGSQFQAWHDRACSAARAVRHRLGGSMQTSLTRFRPNPRGCTGGRTSEKSRGSKPSKTPAISTYCHSSRSSDRGHFATDFD